MKSWTATFKTTENGPAGNFSIQATEAQEALNAVSAKVCSLVAPRNYTFMLYDENGKQVGGGASCFGGGGGGVDHSIDAPS